MLYSLRKIILISIVSVLLIMVTAFHAVVEGASDQEVISLSDVEKQRVLTLRDRKLTMIPKVVGGAAAEPDRWPWAAAIAFKKDDDSLFQYCGGTLIDSRWVLTAAHCDVQKGDKVILGRSNLKQEGGEVIDVTRVLYTRDSGLKAFDPNTMDHDIALVELATASSQQPVSRVGATGAAVSVGKQATVIGWGLLEEGGEASDTLQQVAVPIFSNDSCDALYSLSNISITDNMMCAGLHGKDSCQGDSGGGVFVQNSLDQDVMVGVVSFGIGCARPNFPGVYTRVSNYAAWIVSVTGMDVARLVDDTADQEDEVGGKYVFATGKEVAQEQVLIAAAAEIQVDPQKWEFVGKRSMPDLRKPRANFDQDYEIKGDVSVFDKEELSEQIAPSMDIAIMGLADGRMFSQKSQTGRLVNVFPFNRSRSDGATERLQSESSASDILSAGVTDNEEGELEQVERQIIGTDNRLRSTTSSKPGVMVRIQSTSSGNWGFCSGSMISPRVVLTAAHCITDSNGDFDYGPTYVVPAARGASYSGEKKPQGARWVTHFVKPSDWSGSGAKYDYAMLVLSDLERDTTGPVQWDPKPVYYGYKSNSWLESKNFNLRGYPGGSRACAAAATGDGGQCNGYAYYHDPARKLHNAHATWLTHKHDTQPGQSGAPIYYYSGGERTVYAVHKGAYSSRNRAHRIRSGSFGLMCDVVEDYPSSHFVNMYCE
ncbi:MAG: trypsin-like serine protease [Proteobacteria bacterium]|nr:trypsin-like serine protease [Pseudomonadota bacterium]MBU1057712.1 trypsin-like serine protease [Pseudomonadota bacterium]